MERLNKNDKYKKTKRQIFCIAFFVLLYLFSYTNITNAVSVISPTADFYVNDNAGVLSTTTKQYIINTNVELQRKTGAQIVVVTVKSLNGVSIEEYANQLFNSWGIGDSTKNNGLLLLCSYKDRQFRVEVGYGLEGKLPDGKTGRMQDEYIIPYLREDEFDQGIKNGYSAFLKEVADEYNVTITGSENAVRIGISKQSEMLLMMLPIIIFILTLILQIKFGGRGPFIFIGGGRGGFRWWFSAEALAEVFTAEAVALVEEEALEASNP